MRQVESLQAPANSNNMDFLRDFQAPEHLQVFLTSLAIGLLMGLERERRASARAGLRLFSLDRLGALETVTAIALAVAATWASRPAWRQR